MVRDTINSHITVGIALIIVFGLALYWPLKDKKLLSEGASGRAIGGATWRCSCSAWA